MNPLKLLKPLKPFKTPETSETSETTQPSTSSPPSRTLLNPVAPEPDAKRLCGRVLYQERWH